MTVYGHGQWAGVPCAEVDQCMEDRRIYGWIVICNEVKVARTAETCEEIELECVELECGSLPEAGFTH